MPWAVTARPVRSSRDARARRRYPEIQFTIYGDERQVVAELKQHKNLQAEVTVVHSPEAIEASEKPSQAIRRARTTSMGMAINAVKEAMADAALSGGNTGALMAMSKLALRTMPGIDRPALAALLPTLGETDVIMLGLGPLRARDFEAAGEAAQHRDRGTERH